MRKEEGREGEGRGGEGGGCKVSRSLFQSMISSQTKNTTAHESWLR